MEVLNQFMPWYVAGPLISIVMFLLLKWGKEFGVSDNYRTMCTIMGAGKKNEFFNIDWKKNKWNLAFIGGSFLGAFLTHQFFPNGTVDISPETVKDLAALGITHDEELVPMEIFAIENLFSVRSLTFVLLGGFLVGFGARYAGGCTSGHAISGLSNLQLPSLVAVIGFFIGGLLMTHLFFPYLLSL